MQITEVSVMGVRSAVIELRHQTSPLRFRLFPMVHLGLPSFYREVARRLRDCDLVVSEGMDSPSSMGTAYVLALRLSRQRVARALVTQDIDHAALGVPVRWPDELSRRNERHRHLTFLGWLDVVFFTPILATIMAVGGRTWLLGRAFEISDDTEVRLRILNRALVVNRDSKLLRTLADIHEEHHAAPMTVGIVYGAGHMPAVIHGLRDRFGYRARSAEWLTVFDT